MVYANNVSMAKQFAASGNADAAFTAYSLVFRESGKSFESMKHYTLRSTRHWEF